MTILALGVGTDRVLLLQDSGTFGPAPHHRFNGTVGKIAAHPERRMLSGGCGSTAVCAEWRKVLAAGVAGETLGDIATHAPGLLRELWRSATGSTTIIVAALDDRGLAGALAMSSGDGFQPYRIPRGHVVLIPDTAELPPERPADPAEGPREPAAETVAESLDDTPRPDVDTDWTLTRRRVIQGARLQIQQRRVPFAPPFTLATLHPEGIDLRRFEP